MRTQARQNGKRPRTGINQADKINHKEFILCKNVDHGLPIKYDWYKVFTQFYKSLYRARLFLKSPRVRSLMDRIVFHEAHISRVLGTVLGQSYSQCRRSYGKRKECLSVNKIMKR